MLKRTLTTTAILLFAGCSSWKLAPADPPPPVAQDDSVARICVLRSSSMAWAVTFPVRDNGSLVGATRGPSYFCYAAEEGRHHITTEADEVDEAQVDVVAGSVHYLKQEVDNVLGHVRARSIWLEEETALDIISELTYHELVGVPGSERLPGRSPCARAAEPTRRPGCGVH